MAHEVHIQQVSIHTLCSDWSTLLPCAHTLSHCCLQTLAYHTSVCSHSANVTSNLALVLAQANLMLESVSLIGISVLHTVSTTVGICKSCQHAEVINVRCNETQCQCTLLPSILTLCCACCRAEGRFQLSGGWKPFAQHWNLGHGEQLQLSRCFVSGGCIWLDVKIMQHSLNGAPIELLRPVASTKHFKHVHVHIVSMTLLMLRTCDLALTSSLVNSTLLVSC